MPWKSRCITRSAGSQSRNPPIDSADEANLTAATLDVYEHERLANTAIPLKKPDPESVPTKMSALLKAMYHWVLSR